MCPSNRRLVDDIEHMRKLAILGLFVILTAFVLFEALRGHHFWSKVKGEGNLWNYGSSLLYVLVGEIALLNAVLVSYHRGLVSPGRRSWLWIPWLATAGAFVFLGCDEMLCIHEKAGEILKSFIPMLGDGAEGEPDGLVIAAYAAGALAFSIASMRAMLTTRASRYHFIGGLAMVVLVALFEIVPRDLYINHLPLRETEELVELLAGWLFASSFLSTAADAVIQILRAADLGGAGESVSKGAAITNA